MYVNCIELLNDYLIMPYLRHPGCYVSFKIVEVESFMISEIPNKKGDGAQQGQDYVGLPCTTRLCNANRIVGKVVLSWLVAMTREALHG